MRTFTKLFVAGAGGLAVAGVAIAATDRAHVVDVALPDGRIAHIHYVGDVAPRIELASTGDAVPVAFVDQTAFGMLDRISQAMDQQMDAMLRQASIMASAPDAGQPSEAALKTMPAGTASYSFTSYSSGNGASCSQSVQVTSLGANQAPKVVKQSQGDCTAMNRHAPTPAVQHAKPAAPVLTPASVETAKEPAKATPSI